MVTIAHFSPTSKLSGLLRYKSSEGTARLTPDLRVLHCNNKSVDINYSNNNMSSQRGEGHMIELSWIRGDLRVEGKHEDKEQTMELPWAREI
jgi:hypothetical protein